MASRLFASFVVLLFVVVACDAALPAMVYWNTMLPGVLMPKVVLEILQYGNMQKATDDENKPLFNSPKNSNSFPSYNYHSEKQPFSNDLKKSDSFPSYNYHSEKQPFSNDLKKSDSFPSYNYHSEKQPFSNDLKKSDSFPSYNYHSEKQPFSNDLKKSDSFPSYNYHSEKQPFSNDLKKSDSFPSYNYHSEKQPFLNDLKKSDSFPSYNYHSQKQPYSNDLKKSDSFPSYNYHSGKPPIFNDVKKSDSFPSYNYHSGKKSFSNALKKSDSLPSYNYHSIKKSDSLPSYNYHSGKQPLFNIVKNLDSIPSYNYHSEKQPDIASKEEIHEHDNLFFLEKDLIPFSKINVDLTSNMTGANFLQRQQAESIPFSMDKLTEIIKIFSFKPQSVEAGIVEETIKSCNQHSSYGEQNHCATSLESMVDFIVDRLGRNVKSLSTEIGMAKQQYSSVEKVGGSNSIVCHRQVYPYAVFYCHEIPSTKVYKLQLSSNEDESSIVAVCHEDTSTWNPEFMAFKILNIEPGSTVCHFLHEGNIIWTSEETSA